MSRPRILVTGAAGFIGSHYVSAVLSGAYPAFDGARVTALDRLTYAGNPANLDGLACERVWGDIADAELLRQVVPGHDVVVNFAAESHVDRSIRDAGDFVRTNVLGVHTLLQACLEAGVSRVVQVSTDEVYGSLDTGSWTEQAPLRPRSPYAASKAGGDLVARAYAITHGLPVSISRCGNNYGPRQFPEKIIPLFVSRLLRGEKVPLYGDGGHVRDWVYVEDHCRAVQLVAERGEPGEVYHVAGTAELTNRELTQRLLDACGRDWDLVEHVADRKAHDRRYSLDDSRLRALGYAPQVPFDEGLARTVRWYADHPEWHRGQPAAPGGPGAQAAEG